MNFRSLCLFVSLVALLGRSTPVATQPLFPGQLTLTGNSPNAVALGDLNGDGKPDAVTANLFGSNVSILLGNGDGTFTSAGTVATGTSPRNVQLADVNADNKLDIVTANSGNADSVSVLLGNGNGTFQPKQDYPTGNDPYAVLVTDLNADTRLDIVTANYEANNVGVMRGNGDGTFQPAVYFPAGENPEAMGASDVNSDGKPDIVVTNDRTFALAHFSVLVNSGDLAFQAPVTYDVREITSELTDLLLKDLTGDGHTDVLLSGDRTVALYAGDGSGGFTMADVFGTGEFLKSLAIADFNADGKDDIAAACGTTSLNRGSVTLLLGDGSGRFSRHDTVTTFPAVAIAAADFNTDGRTDVILTGGNSGPYALPLLGNGDGTLLAPVHLETGYQSYNHVSADVNRDGKPDLIYLDIDRNVVSVRIGQGDGTFAPAVSNPAPISLVYLRIADMDNDDIPDIVTHNGTAHGTVHSLSVFLGKGDGTFLPRIDTALVGPIFFQHLLVADFNRDGNRDVLITWPPQGVLYLYPGNGDGTFGTRLTQFFDGNINDIAAGDLNGDGNLDLVAASNNLRVVTLRGNGNGTFQAAVDAHVGQYCSSVILADVNGDTALDILTGCANGKVGVQLNNGGTFGNATLTTFLAFPFNGAYIAAADFDGDGDRDIAAAGIGGNLFVLRNNGSGAFASPSAYVTIGGFSPDSLGDFNGDGRTDLAVSKGAGAVSVLLNRIEPQSTALFTGTLAFEDLDEFGFPPEVVFTFRPTDGSSDFFRIATVGSNGLFGLPGIARKEFSVHIKGRKYLATNVNADLTNGDFTLTAPGPLSAGDANDDNSVDVLDLDLLIRTFDTTYADPGWDIRADLNGDGSNDVLDLDLLIRNFDRTGDE
jgi:hypothetical protein